MPFFDLVVWALVQGASAILPISASAHNAILHAAGLQAAPGAVTAAAHLGVLAALIVTQWQDLWRMAVGVVLAARGRRDPGAHLARTWVIASVPLLIAGIALAARTAEAEADLRVIAWATLAFGVILLAADHLGMTIRKVEHTSFGTALTLGLIQVLALIPGAGRAGVAITAARLIGYERVEAARLSFLLSVPIVAALAIHASHGASLADLEGPAAIAGGLAFLAALTSVLFLQGFLRRGRFVPFAIYRILLGGGLLAWIYGAGA